MRIPELRPKQDCTTRWNSTFHMLKRFLELKNAIIFTLAIVNAPFDPLTQEEWEVTRVLERGTVSSYLNILFCVVFYIYIYNILSVLSF